jgi:hypothetical protein
MLKKSSPLFIAILKSGKQYCGGKNYNNPEWKEIDEPISKVFFRLPDGNFLIMDGYEKYLYLIEGVFDINGINKGKLRIEYLYFMGLKNGMVDSYRVTMLNKKNERYQIGDITKRQYKWEEIKNKYKGWK